MDPGAPLRLRRPRNRERVLCEWDSQFPGYGMHLRTSSRRCCAPRTSRQPSVSRTASRNSSPRPACFGGGDRSESSGRVRRQRRASCTNVDDDPLPVGEPLEDPTCKAVKDDLVTDLYDALPAERRLLKVSRSGVIAAAQGAVCVAIAHRLPCSSHRPRPVAYRRRCATLRSLAAHMTCRCPHEADADLPATTS